MRDIPEGPAIRRGNRKKKKIQGRKKAQRGNSNEKERGGEVP